MFNFTKKSLLDYEGYIGCILTFTIINIYNLTLFIQPSIFLYINDKYIVNFVVNVRTYFSIDKFYSFDKSLLSILSTVQATGMADDFFLSG